MPGVLVLLGEHIVGYRLILLAQTDLYKGFPRCRILGATYVSIIWWCTFFLVCLILCCVLHWLGVGSVAILLAALTLVDLLPIKSASGEMGLLHCQDSNF